MKLPYYVVDAFTSRVFSGNPAGVCPLETWPADEVLQKIAFENNLSETAFFVKEGEGYRLRWFAPAVEVDLCGHGTLASAFVLYEVLGYGQPSVRFESRSGPLTVTRAGDKLVLDFPALAYTPCPAPKDLVEGLGRVPRETLKSMDYVAAFESEEDVRSLSPRLEVLARLDGRGVIATAPGRSSDYVLRCFGPKAGIPEDPVTGSAQCVLAPYWSGRLKKKGFSVRQLSARGGELSCELAGDRVKIGGQAALYLKGEIEV